MCILHLRGQGILVLPQDKANKKGGSANPKVELELLQSVRPLQLELTLLVLQDIKTLY